MGPARTERPEVSQGSLDDGAGRRREDSMPYRELTMIDVKEVLRRWSAGQEDRRIGRESGVDRKTVARYTNAAERLGLVRGRTLTDEEVHGVAQCVQSRPLVAASIEWNEVAQHRERIELWLGGDAGSVGQERRFEDLSRRHRGRNERPNPQNGAARRLEMNIQEQGCRVLPIRLANQPMKEGGSELRLVEADAGADGPALANQFELVERNAVVHVVSEFGAQLARCVPYRRRPRDWMGRAPDYPPMSASAFANSACAARSSTRTSDHIVYCMAISRRFLAACTRSRRERTS